MKSCKETRSDWRKPLATNSEISDACFTALNVAALGYPIAWPGIKFTPPAAGYWLEPYHFPNNGRQDAISVDGSEYMRGIFQVIVYTRPGVGIIDVADASEEVRGAFTRGQTLAGQTKITRIRTGPVLGEPDRLMCVVTIEYAG